MMAYVFEDEFNGPNGAAPDPSKWTYDLGRWTDNNELETYTDSRTNSYLDGQGHLVIKALATGGRHGGYTCPFTGGGRVTGSRHAVGVLEPLVEVEHDRRLCPMCLACLPVPGSSMS
jgi:hypothetical protein